MSALTGGLQGGTRFTDFQRSLGIAPNVLTKRSGDLVEAGLFELRPGDGGGHAEYVLTGKGRDLQPIIIALTEWGDRWAAPDGRPITYEHEGCGGEMALRLECTRCGDRPAGTAVRARLAQRFRDAGYGWAGRDGGTPPAVRPGRRRRVGARG